MTDLLNMRLSLWDKHLLANDIKPLQYQPGVIIIKTPLVTLFINKEINEGCNKFGSTNVRYTAELLTGVKYYCTRLGEFEQWFDKTFNHLKRDIENSLDKREFATPIISIKHDAKLTGAYAEKISMHEQTIEVLSPDRYEMKPGAKMTIDCPFTLEMSSGVIGVFFPKRRFHENKVEIHAALIHCDFNGRPQLILTNKGSTLWEINKDEAIAQLRFMRMDKININNVFMEDE